MLNTPFPVPIPIAIQPQGVLHAARTLPIPFKFEPPTVAVPNSVVENNILDRKRKRALDSVLTNPSEVTSVKLSRDELLKFSSKEYEEYIRNMGKDKPLSPTEQREIKRQRRLIKNREYAQTSRNKKKEQVGQMETQLHQLTTENESLTAQVTALNTIVLQLEQTNQSLVQENNQLKDIIASTGFPSTPTLLITPNPLTPLPPIPTSPTVYSPSSTCSTDESSEVDFFIPSLTTSSDSEDSSTFQSEPLPSLYDSDVLDVDPFNVPFGWSTSNVFTLFILLFSFGIFFNGFQDSKGSFVPLDVNVPDFCEGDPEFEKNSFRGLLGSFSFREKLSENDISLDIFETSNYTCPVPISMLDVLNDEVSFQKTTLPEFQNNNNNNNNHNNNNNNNNNNFNKTELEYLPMSYTTSVLVEV